MGSRWRMPAAGASRVIDVLVTGGSGQVGHALRAAALPAGWVLHAPGRDALDLTNPEALASAISARPWAAVVNAGAYTAVDRAETDSTTAWTVNMAAPRALAAATAAAEIPLIQVSTDYVFAGEKPTPYFETDQVGPLGVYGASKLGGEVAVRAINPRSVVLRTAWVVSPHGVNFVKTMLRLGEQRSHLRIVADQHGAPTTAGEIARALLVIADRMVSNRAAPTGVYHFTCAGEATWCDLARHVFAEAARAGRPEPAVESIAAADYPTPARRPANSRLDTSRITRDFGIKPRDWREAVAETVRDLLAVR